MLNPLSLIGQRSAAWFTMQMLLTAPFLAQAQQPPVGVPAPPLGAGPFVLDTAEQHKIRVTVVTKGLVHPWALAFLPDDSMLITERPGRLRVVRDGVLNPKPVASLPEVRAKALGGLQDIALHPGFAENHILYFTYIKPVENDRGPQRLLAEGWKVGVWSTCKIFWLPMPTRVLVSTRGLYSGAMACSIYRPAVMWRTSPRNPAA